MMPNAHISRLLIVAAGLMPALYGTALAQGDAKPAEGSTASKEDKKTDGKLEKLDRVEVTESPSDEAARRASTAAKIVIGRDELLRYGDSSVGELMKRLPGVTTGGVAGRGGEIRMRGMAGGYTQILVNGERMPPGFSLETLPPEQVERIEVMRAPTAEHGARAIAGTINIVLRNAPPKRANELRLGMSAEQGRWQPSFNWSRNDKLDDDGKTTYNVSVNAQQNDRRDASSNVSEIHDLLNKRDSIIASSNFSESSNNQLNMNARLQFRPSNGEMVAIMPFLATGKGHGGGTYNRMPGSILLPGDPNERYDRFDNRFENRFTAANLAGQWLTRLGTDGKLDSNATIGRFGSDFTTEQHQFLADQAGRVQLNMTKARNSNWNLRSKFSKPLMEEHSLVTGLELSGTRMDQGRTCLEDGISCAYLLDFGEDLAVATRRAAVYAQDDWSVGKQWSFYAGLRWEAIRTESTAKNYLVNNTSRVWSPLFHALYKISDDPKKGRDQIRLSLTRSYKSPDTNDLIGRPTLNSLYPCNKVGEPCGRNEFIYADWAGNPALKPELATGIDLAYEQYLSKGGLLSASVFVRRIENLIRRGTEEESVPWAPVPRFVSRPRNIGTAISSGLELEAKFRLDQFIAEAPQINVRANLSLYKSSVGGIAGPHNRLAQQPRYTSNIGGDYRLRNLPLNLGASLNYTPDVILRQAEQTLTRNSSKRVLDAYAVWAVDTNTALRLSATNLAPQDFSNATLTTTPGKILDGRGTGRTYTLWSLRLELKV